jgi:hypothetical protein
MIGRVSMDFLWYVVFSTIEAVSVLFMMFCLFRFGFRPYLKEIGIASILFSIVSYALRVELSLESYVLVITVIAYAFFAFTIVKAPPFWSVIMSVITFTAYFAIQTVLLYLLIAAGLVTLENVQNYEWDAYLLQVITAIVQISLSQYLFKKGVGFSFSFDKFRWRSENAFMFGFVCIAFVILLVMFMLKTVFYGAIVGAFLLTFLLYLGIRKERAEL